jgi:hypothetical protein
MMALPQESVSSPFSPNRFRLYKMRGSCNLVIIDNANRTDFQPRKMTCSIAAVPPFSPDRIDRRIF